MSAFYGVAFDSHVQILTDGAVYTDDATIERLEEKIRRSDHVPLAVTGRGADGAVKAIAAAILLHASRYSVDETIIWFQDALARRLDATGAAKIDCLIGCISETLGPKLYYFTTFGELEGISPMTLYDAGREHAGGPSPSAETLAEYGLPGRFATESFEECAADIFEAMRRTPMVHLAHPDRPMVFAVGGHVDMTTVSPLGCETVRLRTWEDDKPGQKISPLAALPELPRAVAA